MYTIIDYLNYYKDLTLEEATFNKIDILLFSILVCQENPLIRKFLYPNFMTILINIIRKM